ncbi:hypothetical protein SARC_02468 [Sphaeroforma arctica JP610]|uniref:Telomere-associated protein Rif1 N-terminal domain-containing protein n=1 Tax=Sphaeroforma arctica JP610 TaxID=667725 RepID=A0A0L0G8I0_9EUKA|nr:hypothetical protein SARC_02468 [Sphaeroforma arctica JP610]KNC85347.1 hypothetical protein SARC_02468 [Sphaeroforma arctica JP610]|eukprot:XP_014159249.1 hypothetical protein SARC_02468 [Sphaeroforma arctica JP610]
MPGRVHSRQQAEMALQRLLKLQRMETTCSVEVKLGWFGECITMLDCAHKAVLKAALRLLGMLVKQETLCAQLSLLHSLGIVRALVQIVDDGETDKEVLHLLIWCLKVQRLPTDAITSEGSNILCCFNRVYSSCSDHPDILRDILHATKTVILAAPLQMLGHPPGQCVANTVDGDDQLKRNSIQRVRKGGSLKRCASAHEPATVDGTPQKLRKLSPLISVQSLTTDLDTRVHTKSMRAHSQRHASSRMPSPDPLLVGVQPKQARVSDSKVLCKCKCICWMGYAMSGLFHKDVSVQNAAHSLFFTRDVPSRCKALLMGAPGQQYPSAQTDSSTRHVSTNGSHTHKKVASHANIQMCSNSGMAQGQGVCITGDKLECVCKGTTYDVTKDVKHVAKGSSEKHWLLFDPSHDGRYAQKVPATEREKVLLEFFARNLAGTDGTYIEKMEIGEDVAKPTGEDVRDYGIVGGKHVGIKLDRHGEGVGDQQVSASTRRNKVPGKRRRQRSGLPPSTSKHQNTARETADKMSSALDKEFRPPCRTRNPSTSGVGGSKPKTAMYNGESATDTDTDTDQAPRADAGVHIEQTAVVVEASEDEFIKSIIGRSEPTVAEGLDDEFNTQIVYRNDQTPHGAALSGRRECRRTHRRKRRKKAGLPGLRAGVENDIPLFSIGDKNDNSPTDTNADQSIASATNTNPDPRALRRKSGQSGRQSNTIHSSMSPPRRCISAPLSLSKPHRYTLSKTKSYIATNLKQCSSAPVSQSKSHRQAQSKSQVDVTSDPKRCTSAPLFTAPAAIVSQSKPPPRPSQSNDTLGTANPNTHNTVTSHALSTMSSHTLRPTPLMKPAYAHVPDDTKPSIHSSDIGGPHVLSSVDQPLCSVNELLQHHLRALHGPVVGKGVRQAKDVAAAAAAHTRPHVCVCWGMPSTTVKRITSSVGHLRVLLDTAVGQYIYKASSKSPEAEDVKDDGRTIKPKIQADTIPRKRPMADGAGIATRVPVTVKSEVRPACVCSLRFPGLVGGDCICQSTEAQNQEDPPKKTHISFISPEAVAAGIRIIRTVTLCIAVLRPVLHTCNSAVDEPTAAGAYNRYNTQPTACNEPEESFDDIGTTYTHAHGSVGARTHARARARHTTTTAGRVRADNTKQERATSAEEVDKGSLRARKDALQVLITLLPVTEGLLRLASMSVDVCEEVCRLWQDVISVTGCALDKRSLALFLGPILLSVRWAARNARSSPRLVRRLVDCGTDLAVCLHQRGFSFELQELKNAVVDLFLTSYRLSRRGVATDNSSESSSTAQAALPAYFRIIPILFPPTGPHSETVLEVMGLGSARGGAMNGNTHSSALTHAHTYTRASEVVRQPHACASEDSFAQVAPIDKPAGTIADFTATRMPRPPMPSTEVGISEHAQKTMHSLVTDRKEAAITVCKALSRVLRGLDREGMPVLDTQENGASDWRAGAMQRPNDISMRSARVLDSWSGDKVEVGGLDSPCEVGVEVRCVAVREYLRSVLTCGSESVKNAMTKVINSEGIVDSHPTVKTEQVDVTIVNESRIGQATSRASEVEQSNPILGSDKLVISDTVKDVSSVLYKDETSCTGIVECGTVGNSVPRDRLDCVESEDGGKDDTSNTDGNDAQNTTIMAKSGIVLTDSSTIHDVARTEENDHVNGSVADLSVACDETGNVRSSKVQSALAASGAVKKAVIEVNDDGCVPKNATEIATGIAGRGSLDTCDIGKEVEDHDYVPETQQGSANNAIDLANNATDNAKDVTNVDKKVTDIVTNATDITKNATDHVENVEGLDSTDTSDTEAEEDEDMPLAIFCTKRRVTNVAARGLGGIQKGAQEPEDIQSGSVHITADLTPRPLKPGTLVARIQSDSERTGEGCSDSMPLSTEAANGSVSYVYEMDGKVPRVSENTHRKVEAIGKDGNSSIHQDDSSMHRLVDISRNTVAEGAVEGVSTDDGESPQCSSVSSDAYTGNGGSLATASDVDTSNSRHFPCTEIGSSSSRKSVLDWGTAVESASRNSSVASNSHAIALEGPNIVQKEYPVNRGSSVASAEEKQSKGTGCADSVGVSPQVNAIGGSGPNTTVTQTAMAGEKLNLATECVEIVGVTPQIATLGGSKLIPTDTRAVSDGERVPMNDNLPREVLSKDENARVVLVTEASVVVNDTVPKSLETALQEPASGVTVESAKSTVRAALEGIVPLPAAEMRESSGLLKTPTRLRALETQNAVSKAISNSLKKIRKGKNNPIRDTGVSGGLRKVPSSRARTMCTAAANTRKDVQFSASVTQTNAAKRPTASVLDLEGADNLSIDMSKPLSIVVPEHKDVADDESKVVSTTAGSASSGGCVSESIFGSNEVATVTVRASVDQDMTSTGELGRCEGKVQADNKYALSDYAEVSPDICDTTAESRPTTVHPCRETDASATWHSVGVCHMVANKCSVSELSDKGCRAGSDLDESARTAASYDLDRDLPTGQKGLQATDKYTDGSLQCGLAAGERVANTPKGIVSATVDVSTSASCERVGAPVTIDAVGVGGDLPEGRAAAMSSADDNRGDTVPTDAEIDEAPMRMADSYSADGVVEVATRRVLQDSPVVDNVCVTIPGDRTGALARGSTDIPGVSSHGEIVNTHAVDEKKDSLATTCVSTPCETADVHTHDVDQDTGLVGGAEPDQGSTSCLSAAESVSTAVSSAVQVSWIVGMSVFMEKTEKRTDVVDCESASEDIFKQTADGDCDKDELHWMSKDDATSQKGSTLSDLTNNANASASTNSDSTEIATPPQHASVPKFQHTAVDVVAVPLLEETELSVTPTHGHTSGVLMQSSVGLVVAGFATCQVADAAARTYEDSRPSNTHTAKDSSTLTLATGEDSKTAVFASEDSGTLSSNTQVRVSTPIGVGDPQVHTDVQTHTLSSAHTLTSSHAQTHTPSHEQIHAHARASTPVVPESLLVQCVQPRARFPAWTGLREAPHGFLGQQPAERTNGLDNLGTQVCTQRRTYVNITPQTLPGSETESGYLSSSTPAHADPHPHPRARPYTPYIQPYKPKHAQTMANLKHTCPSPSDTPRRGAIGPKHTLTENFRCTPSHANTKGTEEVAVEETPDETPMQPRNLAIAICRTEEGLGADADVAMLKIEQPVLKIAQPSTSHDANEVRTVCDEVIYLGTKNRASSGVETAGACPDTQSTHSTDMKTQQASSTATTRHNPQTQTHSLTLSHTHARSRFEPCAPSSTPSASSLRSVGMSAVSTPSRSLRFDLTANILHEFEMEGRCLRKLKTSQSPSTENKRTLHDSPKVIVKGDRGSPSSVKKKANRKWFSDSYLSPEWLSHPIKQVLKDLGFLAISLKAAERFLLGRGVINLGGLVECDSDLCSKLWPAPARPILRAKMGEIYGKQPTTSASISSNAIRRSLL